MTGKPVHSMIRVLDEARATEFNRRAIGQETADRIANDDFTLIYLRNATSPFELEHGVNNGRVDYVWRRFDHFTVVGNLDGGYAAGSGGSQAWPAARTGARQRSHAARLFFIKDLDGHSIEVIEQRRRFG